MLDPYRILGVPPGASQAEIKRAYRLLVKAYHPDSAGPGEIQRFLTIQRAYEALKSPSARRLPRSSRPAPAGPSAPPASPWEADPERARATRERAGARRPGAGRGPGAAAGQADAGPRGGSRDSGTSPGGAGRDSGREDRGPSRPRGGRRRSTRKATFGSTTYDEAREQIDPTWSGASWYGPSSGEYWTVNPREYADPRKHGPEYLARARRPLGRAGAEGEPLAGDRSTTDDGSTTGAGARGSAGPAPTDDGPAPTDDGPAPSGPTARADRSAAARRGAGARAPRRPDESREWPPRAERRRPSAAFVRDEEGWERAGPEPGETRRDVSPPAGATPSTSWLDRIPADARDPLRRLVLALIAWPPLGIAGATAAGSATGCLDAAATCTDAAALVPWLLQAAILGVLFAAPPLAAILAAGTVVAAVAAIPATAFLVAIGANYDTVRGPIVLAVLLALAWAGGVAFAVGRRLQRARRGDRRAGRAPVS